MLPLIVLPLKTPAIYAGKLRAAFRSLEPEFEGEVWGRTFHMFVLL